MQRDVAFSYDLNHMNTTPSDQRLLDLLPPTLLADCEALQLRKSEKLFTTGQQPRYLFWVQAGQVVLERAAANGSSVVLQRTHQGFVSEASLQSPRYHCDAVVVVDARITRVPVPALLQALTDDPAFALRWIGMLNQEVRRLRLQCERRLQIIGCRTGCEPRSTLPRLGRDGGRGFGAART